MEGGRCATIDLLGEATLTEGEGEAYAAAARRRCGPEREQRRLAGARAARGRRDRAAAAYQPKRQGFGAHAAPARQRAGGARSRRRERLLTLLRLARELARICMSTWSHSIRARASPLVLELLARPGVRVRGRQPGSCSRATSPTPRRSSTGCSIGCASIRAPTVHDPPGQGRLLGSRDGRGGAAGLGGTGVYRPPIVRPPLRAPDEPLLDARAAARRCDPRSRPTTSARSLTPWLTATASGCRRTLELQVLRGLGDDVSRGDRCHRAARARVLPRRRPCRRHGLPGAAAAREHIERLVPRRPATGVGTRPATGEALTRPSSTTSQCSSSAASRYGPGAERLAELRAKLPLRSRAWRLR